MSLKITLFDRLYCTVVRCGLRLNECWGDFQELFSVLKLQKCKVNMIFHSRTSSSRWEEFFLFDNFDFVFNNLKLCFKFLNRTRSSFSVSKCLKSFSSLHRTTTIIAMAIIIILAIVGVGDSEFSFEVR